MDGTFEQVHNYYERHVFAEVVRRAPQHPEFSADMLLDVACVALNQLPARCVRHDVDLEFYLVGDERAQMGANLAAAVDHGFAFIAERTAASGAPSA